MAMNNDTTTTSIGASSFLSSLFSVRLPITHPDAEITDWELVDASDASEDDLLDVLSDDESDDSSFLLSVLDDLGAKDDGEEFKSGLVALAVIEKKATHDPESEEVEDPESEDENDRDDLDDELVPWSVTDRFGRQRMRKLGTRAFAKMNKTKKFAYTLNRPGCVHGKHGLGHKG